MRRRVLFSAWLVVAVACGGTTVVDPPDDGSGGSGAGTGSSTGTGTGTATGAGSGTATGTATGSPDPCAELEQAYLDAIESARSCNPFIDFEECTGIVNEELPCPCGGTAVNPGNGEALSEAAEIYEQWFAEGCHEGVVCPAVECEPAVAGSCQPAPNGMDGICETVF